jgi:hypothetical protein
MNYPSTAPIDPSQLYPSVDRLLPPERAGHLDAIRSRRAAQLADAEAVRSHDLLMEWRDQAERHAAWLRSELASIDKQIADFKEAKAHLVIAVREETTARDTLAVAKAAREIGSLDRRAALKLRDDVECADQAVLIARRATAEAAAKAVAYLPTSDGLPLIPGRDCVETVADAVMRRKFPRAGHHADGQINQSTWNAWLEMSEDELAALPVWAAARIKRAKTEKEEQTVYAPTGHVFEEQRRVYVRLPVPEFVSALTDLKRQRAQHFRDKAQAAQRALEAARAQVAALEAR